MRGTEEAPSGYMLRLEIDPQLSLEGPASRLACYLTEVVVEAVSQVGETGRIRRCRVVEYVGRIDTKLNALRVVNAERLAHISVELPPRECTHSEGAEVTLGSRQRVGAQRNSEPALRHLDLSLCSFVNNFRQSRQRASRLQTVLRCHIGALRIRECGVLSIAKKVAVLPIPLDAAGRVVPGSDDIRPEIGIVA